MGIARLRRRLKRRLTRSASYPEGALWKECVRAILIFAAASLLSIYLLLPKTGDPLSAMWVGLVVLLGPVAWIKSAADGGMTRARRR